MTLKEAFQDRDFLNALDTSDFFTAFSFLEIADKKELFLLLQEEGYNPLSNFDYIPSHFFYEWEFLTNLNIPNSVTSIGRWAFYKCIGLTSLIIPDSVTSIGEKAFYDCDNITEITIGNGLKNVGDYGLRFSHKLKSVYITDIAAWCNISFGEYHATPFQYDTSLYLDNKIITDLEIPDTVTEIKSHCFAGYQKLTKLILPVSVIDIGDYAFNCCTSLTSVIYKGTIAQFKKTKLHKKKRWRLASDHLDKIICADGVIELT